MGSIKDLVVKAKYLLRSSDSKWYPVEIQSKEKNNKSITVKWLGVEESESTVKTLAAARVCITDEIPPESDWGQVSPTWFTKTELGPKPSPNKRKEAFESPRSKKKR